MLPVPRPPCWRAFARASSSCPPAAAAASRSSKASSLNRFLGARQEGWRLLAVNEMKNFLREGQLETTHANAYRVGHYHTKHCHAAVVSLGGLTPR